MGVLLGAPQGGGGGFGIKDEPRKHIRLGFFGIAWEDVIIAIILFLIIFAYAKGDLTVKEALAYLGVSAGGGFWGYLSRRGKH